MLSGPLSTAAQLTLLIRFNGKQIPEHGALLRRKLLLETCRVQNGLPLFRWNATQILEGATHLALAVSGHLMKGLRCPSYSGLLLRIEVFKNFVALQQTLTLLRRLAVECMQPVHESLLLVLRQTVEPWLASQRVFLLLRCQVLVIIQPLGEMPLLPRTILGLRRIVRSSTLSWLWVKLLLRYRLRPWLLAGLRRRAWRRHMRRRRRMRTMLSGKSCEWEKT